MRRGVFLAIGFFMCFRADAECTWKDDMTAAEISACRDAGVSPPPPSKPTVTEQDRALLLQSQQRLREENQRAAQRVADARKPKYPYVGMSAADAKKLPFPWGEPDHVNTTTTAFGTREQWVYTDIHGSPLRYLYFAHDRLTTIQE